MTGDAVAARAWLTGHLDAGVEGVVIKRVDHAYTTKRAWRKVKTRTSAEAVVGGVLGPITAPVALVLGRRDETGRLRMVGRTGPIPRGTRPMLGGAAARGAWPPSPAVLPPARFEAAGPWSTRELSRQSWSSWSSTPRSTSSAAARRGATRLGSSDYAWISERMTPGRCEGTASEGPPMPASRVGSAARWEALDDLHLAVSAVPDPR